MRRSRILAVAASATALVAFAAQPAVAGPPQNPPPTTTQHLPTTTTGGQGDSGGSASADAGGCHLVSTSQFLGSYCPGTASDTESIKKIMGSEDFKECWDDPMTQHEQQATGYYDQPDATPPVKAYMHRCLRGIDPKTLAVTPPIHIEEWPEYIKPGDHVETIGDHERSLLSFADHSIPYPIAVVSPTTTPRVFQWLSFFDGQPDSMLPGSSVHEVTAGGGGAQLVAREDHIEVQPRGVDEPDLLTCAGGGHKATVDEKPVPKGNCWYQYPQSSASQPDQMFPVRITAYWNVTIVENGVSRPFNSFSKSVTTEIPVTEIQAINVQ